MKGLLLVGLRPCSNSDGSSKQEGSVYEISRVHLKEVRLRVEEALGTCLLPSLQLIPANPAVGHEIWEVMSLLPYEARYRLYGEWEKDDEGNPLLLAARQVAKLDTRSILVCRTGVGGVESTIKSYGGARTGEKQKGRIGILLDFVWYEPLTRSKAENFAAQRARDFHIGWFIHPLVYREYPKTMQNIVKERLPKFTEEEVKMVKGSIDFMGNTVRRVNTLAHFPL